MKLRSAFHKAIDPFPELGHNLRVVKWWISLLRYRTAGAQNPPPHAVKLFWLDHFQKRFNLATLVETGTFYGTTVAALSKRFDQVYSIELDAQLYERAVARFQQCNHIRIVQGDSGKVLPSILKNLHSPALFWLDGHYSGGVTSKGDTVTPILEEIRAIQDHKVKNNVILIDDARLFTGEDQYPLIEVVISYIRAINPTYQIRIRDDMLQAYPGAIEPSNKML